MRPYHTKVIKKCIAKMCLKCTDKYNVLYIIILIERLQLRFDFNGAAYFSDMKEKSVIHCFLSCTFF